MKLKDKKIVLQIFTGGFKNKEDNSEEIINSIRSITKLATIDKVIIGWSTCKVEYLSVLEAFSHTDIEFFLWLPVFSEIGLLGEADLIVDIFGNPIHGYSLNKEENFEFYCPNKQKNRDLFISIYEDYFKDIKFDGVFLDKIRFSSFVNGKLGGFGCFCKVCREDYKHIDLIDLQNDIVDNNFPINLDKHNSFSLISNNWNDYYKIKSDIITKSLKPISNYFYKKGLKIGMDTFSPYMSQAVGQNLFDLAKLADFIKPMMYRHTLAPAGIQFEYSSMLESLNINYDSNWITDKESIEKEVLLLASLDTEVYIGIEVNRIKDIAEIFPEDIEESLRFMNHDNISGYVLSWNILSAPRENIQIALDMIAGEKI